MVTKENARDFLKAYLMCVKTDAEEFTFEGARVLRAYAKYLVEYTRQLGWI